MAEDIRVKLNTIISNNKDKTWPEIVEMLDAELTKENMAEEEKNALKNELSKGFKGRKNKTNSIQTNDDYSDIKFIWIKEKLMKKGYISVLTKNYGYTEETINNMLYELDNAWIEDLSVTPDIALQEKILKGKNKNKWEKLINELKDIEQDVMTYMSIKTTNESHDKKVEAENIAREVAYQKAIKKQKAEKKKKLVMITSVATAGIVAIAGISAIAYNFKKDDIKRNKLETEIEQQLEERFEEVYEDGAKPFIGVSSAEGKYPNNVDWEEFEKDVNAFIEINKPLLENQNNDLTSAERIKKEIVLSSIAYGNKKYGSGGRAFSEKVAKTLGVYEDLDYNAYEDYVDDIADEREGKGARS